MIAVVDYRAGNLTSVMTAFKAIGAEAVLTSSPDTIRGADRVVFPGVGAAGQSMANLAELGLIEPLRETVATGVPFLGICVGFQLLFESSEEDGGTECLGLLPGRVVRFSEAMPAEDASRTLKVPHMGWNEVRFARQHPLCRDIDPGSEFYFVHSYFPVPAHQHVLARTDYGVEFTSGVAAGNIAAFQFHPEKSGRGGLQLLRNFRAWTPQAE